ncbi:MAG TPA: glycosyl hydrolase family 28-related protein [Streptosporangiaceae bacterium]|nr:glycosyl hydrolase family 28-related protein [Streptosporangiaceae bacterium]
MSRSRPGRSLFSAFSAAIAALGLLAAAPAASAAASGPGGDRPASHGGVLRTAPQAGPVRPATRPAGVPDLGPDVYIFTPSMPQSQIQATVDAIAAQQVPDQFGTQRYALLFEPGTYGSAADPLTFQVGYYTEVAGLGAAPGDVVINGTIDVYNQCFPTSDGSSNCIALDNFWRSLSNLTINVTGQSGCQSGTDFWAVSQAAPMRRVAITGGNLSLMDYCSAGPQYASGGFIADSAFSGGTVISGSQQQFIVRNTSLDGWSNGVWNQVFAGDPGAPAQAFGVPGGAGPYTTLATSPVTQEEPFLQADSAGRLSVFVPALQHSSSGPTWQAGATAGRPVPVSRFFIARPGTPVAAINAALSAGRNLILTPGVYRTSRAIEVTRPGSIVLGLGFPTIVPQHGSAGMRVAAVPGVKLSGLIFDAGPVRSPVLLQVGGPGGGPGSAAAPTLVQDVFFRIGGATPGSAADSLVVNSSHVILDDIWAWRADHGAGVGWTDNTAGTGLVVNGSDVTAYGLFVEHYQKDQVIWNGQGGTDIFFQNEMPYDPPSQAAWMAGPDQDGYPAFRVGDRVSAFQGYGMGSYSFFELGIPIEASMAFQVPDAPGVRLHDLLTVFLNGSGGIESVVNGTGAAVHAGSGGPSNVISYP